MNRSVVGMVVANCVPLDTTEGQSLATGNIGTGLDSVDGQRSMMVVRLARTAGVSFFTWHNLCEHPPQLIYIHTVEESSIDKAIDSIRVLEGGRGFLKEIVRMLKERSNKFRLLATGIDLMISG